MLPETISYYNNATKCIIILAVGSHEERAVKRLVYIYHQTQAQTNKMQIQ